MVANVQGANVPQGAALRGLPLQESTWCSKLYECAEVVVQVAIRAFFIAAHVILAVTLFPISWHWIAVPIVAIGSSTLAAFFFPNFRIIAPSPIDLPPLIRRYLPVDGLIPEHYPDNSPVGYLNRGNDCAFNATLHLFDSEPQLANWLRNPITDATDLPTFLAFLQTYNPPEDLRRQFGQYVEAQPLPQPSVRQMFYTFLEGYVPPEASRIKTDDIKSVFENLRHAHEVLSDFYQANDAAVQNRRGTSQGNSHLVRAALSRVNNMITNDRAQVTADAIGMAVADYMLPDHMKMQIERIYHYNMEGRPPIQGERPRQLENFGLYPLDLPQGNPAPTLNGLLSSSWNYPGEEPMVSDGIAYPVDRVTVSFLEKPPALRFWVKRFVNEPPPEGLANQFLKYMQREWPSSRWILPPPIGWREAKLNTPLECPEEISITLHNGEVCRYRLSSFVTHKGRDNSGHYVAGEIRNGHKFIEDDSRSTLVENMGDQANWDAELRQAYLLCYLPVAADPE